VQKPNCLAVLLCAAQYFLLSQARLLQRLLGADGDKTDQLPVQPFDALQAGLG